MSEFGSEQRGIGEREDRTMKKMTRIAAALMVVAALAFAPSLAMAAPGAPGKPAGGFSFLNSVLSLFGLGTPDGAIWGGGNNRGGPVPDGAIWGGGNNRGGPVPDGAIWGGGNNRGGPAPDGAIWGGGNNRGGPVPDGAIWG
jgi:hypothetical protein